MTQKETPKVKSIVLTIGKKELTLSPEECRGLKEALEEMFPTPPQIVTKELIREIHNDWWNYPYRPYVTWSADKYSLSDTCNTALLPNIKCEAKY